MSDINESRFTGGQGSEKLRVYHAHGYVIHNANGVMGEEIWTKNSAFSEVFFGFEKAAAYLTKTFDGRLADIYRQSRLLEGYSEEECDVNEISPEWRSEYIEEYIGYKLIISEINARIPSADEPCGDKHDEPDFTQPQKIDWVLRFDGEVITRYFVFGEKRYEFRENDCLPEAGTKFKTGDLVIYKDCESRRGNEDIFVILTPPDKPENPKIPWINRYKLIYIKDLKKRDASGRLEIVAIHEDDLTPCTEDYLEGDYYKDTIRSLQWVVKDGGNISPEKKAEILRGAVLSDLI